MIGRTINDRFRGPQIAIEYPVKYLNGPAINARSRGPEINKSYISVSNCEPQNMLFILDRSVTSVAGFRTA